MSNNCFKGAHLNGFTREHLLNLIIQNELRINTNGDTTSWIITEDVATSALLFKRNNTTIFTLTTDGDLTIAGEFLGVVNLIQDDDGTTSVTTDEISETITFNTNSTPRAVVTSVGNFIVNTDTIFVDAVNDRVGINKNPSVNFDVAGLINTDTDYQISNTSVLTSTTLGAGVVNSSLTNVGTLTSLTMTNDLNITTGDIIIQSGGLAIGNFTPTLDLSIGDADTGLDQVSDGILRVMNNNSETMRFNSNGDVGIGVNGTPDELLHLQSSSSTALKIETTSGTADPKIILTTNASSSYIGIDNGSADRLIIGVNSEAVGTNPAIIIDLDQQVGIANGSNFEPELTLSIGDADTGINWTSDNNIEITTGGTDRMRFGGSIINCFSAAGQSTEVMNLRKSATNTTDSLFIEFFRSATNTASGTTEGDIRLNGSGDLAFQNPSDSRLKENITDYVGGYDKIKALRPVEFEWIDEQKKTEIGRKVGFIAQEVMEILPKSVGTFKIDDDDDIEYYGISLIEQIPFIVSALKTSIDKIETLERRVSILES